MKRDPGTDISTSPLALASVFLKKGLSGKYILVFTCPNGQADFLNIFFYIVNSQNTQKYVNKATKLKRKWFSKLEIHDKQYMPFLHMLELILGKSKISSASENHLLLARHGKLVLKIMLVPGT